MPESLVGFDHSATSPIIVYGQAGCPTFVFLNALLDIIQHFEEICTNESKLYKLSLKAIIK